ncbi:MAG: ABC transporter permease [Candidatus Latescibacterota bacterium]
MRKTMLIAGREYSAAVRTKRFLISLILMPIFMSSGFIAIKLSQKMADVTDKTIAVIDRSGTMAEVILQAAKTRNETELLDKTGKKVKPAYRIEIIAPDDNDPAGQRLALSDRIRGKKLHAFVEIGPGILHPAGASQQPNIAYYSENAVMDDMRQWLSWPVNNQLRRLRLADAGIDESKVKDLFTWMNISPLELASVDRGTGKVEDARRSSEKRSMLIPLFTVILMFMLIQTGSNPLISTVIEEKSQRIAEVMLGSIQPFQFMMGKVIGGVGVALTASLVYIGGAIGMLHYMGMGADIPYHLLPWFFSFLILATLMFGSMFAALGSACNDIKEVQTLVLPAMLMVIIPMMVIMPVLREPMSAFSTGMSLFPPFTPMLMMLRISSPSSIPAWQPFVGIIGVLALTIISVWAGGRIFRVGILMQGKPPKLGEIFRWVVRG